MRHLVLSLLGIVVFVFAGQAQAQVPQCDNSALSKAMRASIHRINGENILVLAGGIESESGKQLRPYIRNKRAYKEVWLCSGGGSVNGGIAIGKALNAAKATVKTPNGYFCASACTIAFMGGYARIIEPQARFVTHASSSAMSFGYEVLPNKSIKFSFFGRYYCNESSASAFCSRFRVLFTGSKYAESVACSDVKDVYKANTKCIYFDTKSMRFTENQIFANSMLTQILSNDETLSKLAISHRMKGSVSKEIRLLKYFQLMLIDGRSDLIDHRNYKQIELNFTPTNIYDLESSDPYSRSLSNDIVAMKKVQRDIEQTFAIWQTVLTDGELSVKTQLSEHVKRNNIDLGIAAEEALKMYDAMRTCQIQSSCRLEEHTARSLGYHNMYGHD